MRAALTLPLLLLAGCGAAERAPERAPAAPPVVFLTDFALKDDAVGLMKGVVLGLSPRSPLVDLTHEVPPFDVAAGARLLEEAPGVYPPGSVFVVVVDPGVGTARRPIAARLASGTLLVGPDNGVLALAIAAHGPAEVRHIVSKRLVRTDVSTTFHGRDVFAPVAGHLAAGVPFEEVGPVVEGWQKLDLPQARRAGDAVVGEVTALDEPWGNVLTNIPRALLDDLGVQVGGKVEVTIGQATLVAPRAGTFGDVPEGQPLIYENSRGRVALALNLGDFARKHGVTRGQAVRLRAAK